MNSEFQAFLERACRAIAREVPEFPTQMGLFEIDGEPVPQNYFAGFDAGSLTKRQQGLHELGRGLAEFPDESLDAAERISAGVVRFFTNFAYERGLVGRAGAGLLDHDYLVRPSVGLQSELPLFMAELHPMRDAADAEAYLARLDCLARQIDEVCCQLRDHQARPLLPPTMVLLDTVEEVEGFLASAPEAGILYAALEQKTEGLPGLNEAGRARILAQASRQIGDAVYPAYSRLLSTLRSLVPVTAVEPGIWRLPEGEAWYSFLLRSSTTTTMTADDVHELGLQETSRLQQDIRDVCRDMGIEADSMTAICAALDARCAAPLADTDASRKTVVKEVERLIAEIEARLPSLFRRLPRGTVTVKPIPRFAEAHRNQSYQPPSLDGSRAGRFELNVGQLLDQAAFELPILVYHEIFPGHHLQFSLAQEDESLPKLRRIITFDAYIEGWAKYAETIPERHAINTSPNFRLARMRRELVSSANLALDTGIHAKRWSEADALDFCQRQTGCGLSFARYLVHRSAAVPAQMCAYKIGMLRFEHLRNKFETARGLRFDVREFHEAVLSCGAVPLDLLEHVVDLAITSESQFGA